MRRVGAVVGAASLLTTLLVLVPASTAAANDVITVTVTDDVTDPEDGLSLREAVAVANQTSGADTIVLAADEEYLLDEPCPQEPSTVEPALLVHDAAGLTIEGAGATIHQAGAPSAGCDRRVITNDQGSLTLRDLTLRGGVADRLCGQDPPDCPEIELGVGGAVATIGPLVLDGVHVLDNEAEGAGGGVWAGSPALTAVTVIDSTIEGNRAPSGGGIEVHGDLTVLRSSVTGNRAPQWNELSGLGRPGIGGGISAYSLTLTQSLVAGNSAEGSNYFGHCVGAAGGGLRAGALLVSSTTIADNVAEAAAGECLNQGDPGGVAGGIYSDAAFEGVTLEHATVTGNVAGYGAALATLGPLTITASVIGESPGASPCSQRGEVFSGGYNVMSDRCGFPVRRTDRRNVSDLGLGPLTDNGGPTLTRLPTTDGPLSIIPPELCGADPDQRGDARPQGACEAGAVEVDGSSSPTVAPPWFPPHPFTDVTGGPDGIDEALDWAVVERVAIDHGDHLLRPRTALSRAEAVRLLWRLMGKPAAPPGAQMGFEDVPLTASYRPALLWAATNEHPMLVPLHFRQFRFFDAAKRVTRYQFATMLWFLAGAPSGNPRHPFPDLPSAMARAPLDWVALRDLLPSLTGPFRPNNAIKRAQAVVLLHRAASNPDAWLGVDPPPTNDF